MHMHGCSDGLGRVEKSRFTECAGEDEAGTRSTGFVFPEDRPVGHDGVERSSNGCVCVDMMAKGMHDGASV